MFHTRPARPVRAYRTRLEVLEDRTLPSTFLVDHLADDTVGSGLTGSLRYAITNAADNDHIAFGVTGTINLTGALPTLAHSVSIEGPGAAQLTVRHDTGGFYGIFAVGGGTTVGISGLSITNAYDDFGWGGGIDNSGTLTVSDSTISGNLAENGGGICNGGMLTVSNCTIRGNGANGAEVMLGEGGGIANFGALTLSNSTVSGNAVIGYGGGIYNSYGGYAVCTVSYSTISGNTAHPGFEGRVEGGGIDNHGTFTLSNSTVSGNSVPIGVGGGIHNVREMTVNCSTVSGNVSDDGGAGILDQGNLTLTSSTISGNSSSIAGGSGLCILDRGTVQARNTIIAGNIADYAPDLIGDLGSLGHNLIGNTEAGSGFDPTDLLNVDPLLGPLQDNGGPTQTMALLPGSPALNAGDPAQLGAAEQRGVIRTGGVNIGAFQASASAFVLTVAGSPTAGVPFDLTVLAVDLFGRAAVGYTGTVTFATDDPDGGVPPDYTFTAADAGSHTFAAGVTLYADGSRVTATDTQQDSLTGSVMVPLG
jgi:hypothetical protein